MYNTQKDVYDMCDIGTDLLGTIHMISIDKFVCSGSALILFSIVVSYVTKDSSIHWP